METKTGRNIELITRTLKSARKCNNCHRTMKNKFDYIIHKKAYYLREGETKEYNYYFGIERECTRCGYINPPNTGIVKGS